MSESNVETLIGLVSQYSPSGQEQEAVEWLVQRMKTLGFARAFVDEAGDAVGVIGDGPGQIVLLGHIDTVPGQIPVKTDDDVLYGRGSVDAKGPLACFVDAVAEVGVVDGWQFVVIGAVEEEQDSDGARHVVDQYSPDYAVVGEPNHWDRIALGYKGSAWADVTIKCPQMHSASGEQTACEAAVDVWQAVQSFAEDFNVGKKRAFDKVLPTLRGLESEMDDFQQRACLKVGVRLPPALSPDDWYLRLKDLSRLPEPFVTEVSPRGYPVPAWACEKNSRLVRAFLKGIRSQGGEPRFVYKTGTADLNIVAPVWKCPALVYGPGDSGLDHTPDEHISLDEYLKSVRVLSASLAALVAGK